ncbi:hypothetical protein [Rhodococcus sp. WMMA185]|nr:hypothetical protein [Rhodococcus sp. WMMA185]
MSIRYGIENSLARCGLVYEFDVDAAALVGPPNGIEDITAL